MLTQLKKQALPENREEIDATKYVAKRCIHSGIKYLVDPGDLSPVGRLPDGTIVYRCGALELC